jgi:hypothetical protein
MADFTYEQTSQMTGGAMLGMMKFAGAFAPKGQKPTDPVATTVSIKGGRMLRKSLQQTTIIDLDSQTITTIRFAKKTYSTMTFAQLKAQLQKISDSMKSDPQKANASMQVKVNDTGQTKIIAGNQTHEMVLTITMATADPNSGNSGGVDIASDLWISPDVSGYGEVRDFHKRMAEEIDWMPGDSPMMSRPDLAKAMAQVYQQESKLNGLPLETVVKMTAAGQSGSTAAAPAQQGNTSQQPQNSSASAALSNALNSHFGLGRHKKQDDGSNQDANAGNGASGTRSGSLIEMTSTVTSFNSNAVDASVFEIPAGFKQVEEDLGQTRQR